MYIRPSSAHSQCLQRQLPIVLESEEADYAPKIK